jgi:hypothetical protein
MVFDVSPDVLRAPGRGIRPHVLARYVSPAVAFGSCAAEGGEGATAPASFEAAGNSVIVVPEGADQDRK